MCVHHFLVCTVRRRRRRPFMTDAAATAAAPPLPPIDTEGGIQLMPRRPRCCKLHSSDVDVQFGACTRVDDRVAGVSGSQSVWMHFLLIFRARGTNSSRCC